MDPNEALRQLRARFTIIDRLLAGLESDEKYIRNGDLSELIDLFQGLDEWLSKGGFLPDAWEVNRRSLGD